MIYLDSSVVLAHVLSETRRPPAELWAHALISSRLLEYEVWTQIHARKLGPTHSAVARSVTDRLAFLELIPEIVSRAREPIPAAIRTLDALHLASCIFLVNQGQDIELATFDTRMIEAAKKLKLPLFRL
ncbi:MAG: PIN domain-containing protein [Longimicrobiales bacterium]